MKKVKPRVLCVDDQAALVAGMKVTLRREFDVTIATSGHDALEIMEKEAPFAVICVDMKMPKMSGAVLLVRVRELYPNTVRMLLTGFAESEHAINAVNEGQIYRFLTKPCPPPDLRAACSAAVERHRQLVSDLEQRTRNLQGSVSLTLDVLRVSSPAVFARLDRVACLAEELAQRLEDEHERWQIRAAAVLSQLGTAGLSEAVHREYESTLVEDGKAVVDPGALQSATADLLGRIGGLDSLGFGPAPKEQLATCGVMYDHSDQKVTERWAKILSLAAIIDRFSMSGVVDDDIHDVVTGDPGVVGYDSVLEGVDSRLIRSARVRYATRAIGERELAIGQLLVSDVKSSKGALLLERGNELSEQWLERLQAFPSGYLSEPILVESRLAKSKSAGSVEAA